MSDIITNSAEETISLGRLLADVVRPGDVVELCGQLGADKTRFAKGLAAGLGIADEVTSPTFNLVYEYYDGRIPLYHFDLYRLDTATQLDDIAYWELLEGDGVSVLEWGDRFPEAMPADFLQLTFTVTDDGARSIEVASRGVRGEVLATALLEGWKERI